MILKIHTKRIIRILFVFMVLMVYAGLMIWTAKKVYAQVNTDPYQMLKQRISNDGRTKQKITTILKKPLKILSLGKPNKARNKENDMGKCKIPERPREDVRWFMRCYNPEIEPQWTLANINADKDTIDWWYTLHGDDREKPLINSGEVIENLFSFGLPSKNLDYRSVDEKSNKCRRCAVVGNSMVLTGSKFGRVLN